MKPLITFTTFNRMGGTIESLPSLLKSPEDFDLCLLDNFSQDHTWDYIQSINDPRIIVKKRFDRNIGGSSIANFGLTHRKPKQDWINFEYDYVLQTPNFISLFNKYKKEFPNVGAFSAIAMGSQDNEFFKNHKNKIIESFIWGFCWFVPASTMNKLGYMDEVSYMLDIEFNARIQRGLKLKTAYIPEIKGNLIYCKKSGWFNFINSSVCPTCKTKQSFCEGGTDPVPCVKYYSRITTKWLEKYQTEGRKIIEERINGIKSLKCGSIHDPKSGMPEINKETSLKHSQFFTDEYNKIIHDNT